VHSREEEKRKMKSRERERDAFKNYIFISEKKWKAATNINKSN
jgi:hypothetical protein